MLVSNVQDVEIDKVFTLPSNVRLHLVGQGVDNVVAGTIPRLFMSLHGGFASLPGILPVGVDDGEEGSLVNSVAIGRHKCTVSVIQGGPEIVQRIAKHGWGVLREVGADRGAPGLAIILWPKGLFVSRNVAFEDAFEMVDVMFGPFGL